MTDPDIRRAILDIAVEDSYALSEVVAQVHAVRPELSPSSAREITKSAVEELLDAGLIAVTQLDTPNGSERELTTSEARAAIADDLGWMDLPSWRTHARVCATHLGREAYYGDD